MKGKVGQIIKLKDNTDYAGWGGEYEYAIIKGEIDDNLLEIEWIPKTHKIPLKVKVFRNNIVCLVSKKIKAVFNDLREGDIVITNGDGDTRRDTYIYGKIGEKSGTDMWIWNNIQDGRIGIKPIKGYLYSWTIRAQSTGRIVIIKKSEAIIPDKCCQCKSKEEVTEGLEGNFYCKKCMEELFFECEKCHNKFKVDEQKIPEDGGIFCENCYNDEYTHCESCGIELFRDDEAKCAEDWDWCEDCFLDRFGICESCGTAYRWDNLVSEDDGNTYFCKKCMERKTKKIIHDYHYNPEFVYNKEEWEEPLYLGVELEVQREEGYLEYAKKFFQFLKTEGKDKYYYLKNDGSLRTNGDETKEYLGFEIVTHPFTLQYAHKNLGFNKILEWLKTNEFSYGEKTQRCGLHVHMSKDFFEERDITKLRLFFLKNQKKLFKFSKRIEEENEYCRYEKLSVEQILEYRGNQGAGRHWALNLSTDKETLEIRIFNSTLDTERFIAILQFADALAHFVKVVGITSLIIGEREYKNNSWKLFTDWAKDERKYGTMLKCLKKDKLVKV